MSRKKKSQALKDAQLSKMEKLKERAAHFGYTVQHNYGLAGDPGYVRVHMVNIGSIVDFTCDGSTPQVVLGRGSVEKLYDRLSRVNAAIALLEQPS